MDSNETPALETALLPPVELPTKNGRPRRLRLVIGMLVVVYLLIAFGSWCMDSRTVLRISTAVALIAVMVRVPLASAGSPDEPAPPTAIM